MKKLALLERFRKAMLEQNIDAYIVPSSDPHQSEYVAEHWKTRAWLSGFTGSAGTAVITLEDAGVWTDSRYFLQAEEELKSSAFKLHKVYNHTSPQYTDWLVSELKKGSRVACDGRLFSKKQEGKIRTKLKKAGISLTSSLDIPSDIWEERPRLPSKPIFSLDIALVGESRKSKLSRIRSKMAENDCQYHLISTLDDIAWTFNIRGSDVPYNPVAYAYAIIGRERSYLFIAGEKVEKQLVESLKLDGIEVKSYEGIWAFLNALDEESSILIDSSTISAALFSAINSKNICDQMLPSIKMKAVKNEVEIQNFRNAMIKDGLALTRFYIWLENNLDHQISEYEVVQKIAYFRSKGAAYQSESFGAIVGYKGNGAIVHYTPSVESSAILAREGLLLIDSGGQYLDGTTDITRTTSLGNPTSEEKNAYTRVLKGNIALDCAVFPEGTLGVQLDTLARNALWADKMNFLHGTGHGVGFFLNVHEGPQGIHPGIASRSKNSIDEHTITTNEPGYYEAGKFGIRIENCLLCIKAGSSSSGTFLKFETLTLFPIDTNLIDFSLLTKDEVEWLNNYHKKVFMTLSPHLDNEELNWLERKCRAI